MKLTGLEWIAYTTPMHFIEVDTVPSGGEIAPNMGHLYAKDVSAVTHLMFMDDAGVEHDLSGGIFIGEGVTSGTPGSVLFVGTGPVLSQDNANFFWDATNKRLGLGITSSLNAALHVSYQGAAEPSVQLDQYGGGANDSAVGIIARAARSTKASPSGIASNDRIFSIDARGYHNSGAFPTSANALFAFKAAEAFTSTAQGTYAVIETTPAGSTTRAEALRLDSKKNLIISSGLGALATNATDGFIYFPTSAGAPTGTPTSYSGKVALEYDTTNDNLKVFNGSWKTIGGGMAIGNSVTSGTTGSVLFIGSGPVLSQDNSNFFWDNTNKRLGLGINSGLNAFIHIAYQGAAEPSVQFAQYSGGANDCAIGIISQVARSTKAGPSGIATDDRLFSIDARGYQNGGAFTTSARALLVMKAAESFTPTNQGAYISFATTAIGSSSAASERFRVGPSGQWGIGGATYGNSGDYFKSTGSSTAPTWTAPAALTKTDDTNVTLTLGGSPTTALFNATSLTLGWTGTLAISRGGTGQSTANAALNALLPTQTGNAGNFLTTDGTNTSWAAAGGGSFNYGLHIAVPQVAYRL